jgi:hypothetical protein
MVQKINKMIRHIHVLLTTQKYVFDELLVQKNYKFDFRITLAPFCQASFAAKLVKNEVNWLLKLEKKEDVGKIPRISLHLSFVRIIDIWHLHQFQIFSLLLRISNPQLFKPDRFAFMKTAKFVNKALAVASSTLVNLFTW